MANFPDTRISLILRLAEPADVQAWREFADIYTPVLLGLAKRRGLQAADAEDVTQEIMFGVARAVERFQPDQQRAKFRTWLARIARNLIADALQRRGKTSAKSLSDGDLETHGQCMLSAQDSQWWDQELRLAVFRLASNRVRGRVSTQAWRAYEAGANYDGTAAGLARELGMQPGAVYVARCRVMKQLREESQRLLQAYEQGDLQIEQSVRESQEANDG